MIVSHKSNQLKKYQKYKSGVSEYSDFIPEHWAEVKLKYLAKLYNGDSLSAPLKEKFSTTDSTHTAYISSKDINVNTSQISYESGLRIPKGLNYKVAPRESSLICIEGGSAGKKIAFTAEEVCFVNKLACIHSTQAHNKFLFYSLKGKLFQSQFFSSMSGLIGGVSLSAIENFKLATPPLNEQILISQFLDSKVQELDRAISFKEQQIALLKERVRVVVREAVTNGLNKNVGTIASNIAWIGDIPEHWKIIRFKNLFQQSKLNVRKDDEVVTSFRDGQVTLRSNRRLSGYTEAILEGGYQGVRKGQLVLNSMDAFEGAIGVSESDGKCTPEYVVCDPKSSDVCQFYFAYLLREMALARYIQVICNAVRQRAVRIRFNNLANLFMVVPPLNEQKAIVEFISQESKQLKQGINQLNKQIEKLKEYKSSLISDAVTGKIKVPEVV